MIFKTKVKMKIGDKLKTDNRIYSLIGYEYVESRGIRYILMYSDNGKPDWIYLFDFEMDLLKS